MDLSQLPPHELSTKFRDLTNENFLDWILTRSEELVCAARREQSNFVIVTVLPPNLSELVVIETMLLYGQNLKQLHKNLQNLTHRLMVHNPGQTSAQVMANPQCGYRRSASFMLISMIMAFPQETIDAVCWLTSILHFQAPLLPLSQRTDAR